tara:strand:- start:42 stop:170 length:129 start_codon:yes stop_codon:yes gene_type:complete
MYIHDFLFNLKPKPKIIFNDFIEKTLLEAPKNLIQSKINYAK